jgi:uncharacterized protein DUF4157
MAALLSLQKSAGNAAVSDLFANGAPLPPTLRRDMEQRFGCDFSAVRIHQGSRAEDATRKLSAKAVTIGQHIAFDTGRFAPDTSDGKRLIAHELTHVVQQSRGGSARPSLDGTGPLESEAARSGQAAGGEGPIAVSGNGAVGPAADPDEEARKALQEEIDKIDQERANADKDDEPAADTAMPRPTWSLITKDPRQFTDEQIEAPLKEWEPISEAIRLGEKQARRRIFWDSLEGVSDWRLKLYSRIPEFREAAAALDLDIEKGTFERDPAIDKQEHDLWHHDPVGDPDGKQVFAAYEEARENIMNHQPPPPESLFHKVFGGEGPICQHFEPCKSNIEQMHRDKEAGMSDAEAINAGMARLTVFAETLALPTPGPSGPIKIGPGGTPSGPVTTGPGGTPTDMPYNVPATDPAIPAGGETTVAPRPKPLETTGGGGSKGPEAPVDQPASVAEDAVPESILDDAPTNRVPQKPLEQVGEYKIDGKKSFDGNTFSREIEGLYRDQGPTTDVRPVRDLINRFRAEAKANGAKELRVTGKIVRDQNIMRLKRLVEHLRGTVRKIDEQTIEFTIPID